VQTSACCCEHIADCCPLPLCMLPLPHVFLFSMCASTLAARRCQSRWMWAARATAWPLTPWTAPPLWTPTSRWAPSLVCGPATSCRGSPARSR
jgi:hypothetical protein